MRQILFIYLFREKEEPEGQNINQRYWRKVFARLRERVRENDTNCGRTSHGFSILRFLNCFLRN